MSGTNKNASNHPQCQAQKCSGVLSCHCRQQKTPTGPRLLSFFSSGQTYLSICDGVTGKECATCRSTPWLSLSLMTSSSLDKGSLFNAKGALTHTIHITDAVNNARNWACFFFSHGTVARAHALAHTPTHLPTHTHTHTQPE